MNRNLGTQDNVTFHAPVINIIQQLSQPNEGAGTSTAGHPTQVRTEQLAAQRGQDETKVMNQDENEDRRADALCQLNSQMEKLSTGLATLEEQVKSCKDNNSKLENRTTELEEQNKELKDKNSKLEDRTTELEEQNMELEDKNSKLEDRTTELEEQNKELKDKNRKLEDRTTGLEDRTTGLEDRITELEEQNKELKDKNNKLEYRTNKLEEQNRELEDWTTKVKIQNRQLEDQNKRLDALTKELEEQNKRLESDVRELKSRNPNPAEREEVMGKLVECAVKQEEPTVEEAVDLLPSARRLGMKNLVGKLVGALTKALAVTNCIIIFQLASLCQLDELVDASVDTICKNFIQVSRTCTDFCKLSLEEVSRFVFSDSVRATEEHVFEAMVLWVRADESKRQSLLSQLLPAVRVSRCSSRFLKQTLDHFLVQDQHLFRTSTLERIQWMTSAGVSEVYLASRDLYRTDDRDLLFVMGGYFTRVVETLAPAVGCWVSNKIPDAPSNWTWIGSVGQKVLVLERDNKRFRSLDVPTREWTELQYLPQHRGGYTVASTGDQVYVLGGDEPHGNRCDSYDAETYRWGEAAPMREGRRLAASVCHAGKLYCSGGWSVPGDQYLPSLEVLDPRGNGKWTPLPPMGVRRRSHCLASCARFVWAVGGYDGVNRLSDVEKYDAQVGQWSRVPSLNEPRDSFSVSVVGGRLHVVGGLTTGYTGVGTVEVYDEEENRWSSAAPLHKERYRHGSCVFRCLPDAVADKFSVPLK